MSQPHFPKQSDAQGRLSVSYEAEQRQRLLDAVTITKQGLAVCENPLTRTVMRMAAVRVTDKASSAAHIPFETGDDGKVNFALPADKPSQVGFFVEYSGLMAVSAAVRVGDYPGTPLITTGLTKHEALINLGGIKPTENDEHMFAGQIDLFGALDFNPAHTRGVFSKAHHTGGNTWNEQRIVMLPKGTEDLLDDVTDEQAGSTFQLLGYETETVHPPTLAKSTLDEYLGRDFGWGVTKRQAPPMMTADFTAGFGNSFETNHQRTSIRIASIQGAFAITAVCG